MKSFNFALFSVIILILLNTFFLNYIKTYSQDLTNVVNEIINYVENNDYKNAKGSLNKLKEIKDNKDKTLLLILNHEEVSEISSLINECEVYIKKEENVDTISTLTSLKDSINYLYTSRVISIANIF